MPDSQDLTYDNFVCSMLSAGTAITDVIDITPALAGGRAFASATLPLCHHDYKQIRDLMRGQLVDLAGSWTACANLSCVVLWQLDWPSRHHPVPSVNITTAG